MRILDPEGNLVASPSGRLEDALPLSDEGLTALQDQQDWWESASVSGENMLIYSHPITQDGETIYIVQVARSLTERDRTLKSLATTLAGVGVLTILVAFGAGWALSRYSLNPLTASPRPPRRSVRSVISPVGFPIPARRMRSAVWPTPLTRC